MGSKFWPWGDQRTEILLSFAMENHGGFFANWLRERLRKTFHLYDAVSVYMDNIALRSGVETIHTTTFQTEREDGITYSTRDTQVKFAGSDMNPSPTGFLIGAHRRAAGQDVRPIGALNSMWNEAFQEAMSQCHTMIFCVTKEFARSTNTMQEISQFEEENLRRQTSGKPLILGIALVFPKAASGRALSTQNLTPIYTTGIKFTEDPNLWAKNSFGISESDYGRVVGLVKERRALQDQTDGLVTLP